MGEPLNDQLNQYLRFLACVIIALILWLSGAEGAPQQGWQIFSVFIAVIASFILQPFPMGTMVLLGLVTLTATHTITMKEALSGYGDSTVWLVVAAFLLAGGVMHSGFGRRLALTLESIRQVYSGIRLRPLWIGATVGSSGPLQYG